MKGTSHNSLTLVAATGIVLSLGGPGPARAAEASGSGAAPASAPASEPSKQELLEMMKAMQAKIDKLEAREQEQQAKIDGQVKEQRELEKRQVDLTVEQIRRDAERHSQLLDMEGFTAGYSNGKFVIQSGDGSFSFHPWLHLQFRGTVNHREDALGGGKTNDTESGFELRRARFGFDGNLFSPDLNYFFNWATARANGTATVSNNGTNVGTVSNNLGGVPQLEEAWVKYHFHDTPFYVKAGQVHDPLAHEEIVGSKYEVTAERSIQNDIFSNVDAFTQAVTFIYDPKDAFRFEGGVNQGMRDANTNFQDFPNNGNGYDWGVAGRAEYKVFGNWKDYDQITAYGNKSDLLVFGAGFDYSEAGKDAQLTHAIDAQFGSTSGLFLYGSYIGRYTRHNIGIPNASPVGVSYGTPAVAGLDTYEPSILGQISFALDEHWEPFGRYEYMHLAGTTSGSRNDVQEITVGVNYWFHGHNAKLTTQVMFLPNGIPVADTSSDILSSNRHSETVFTTQFQLLL